MKFQFSSVNTSSSVPDYAAFVNWTLDFIKVGRFTDRVVVKVNDTQMFISTIDLGHVISNSEEVSGYFSQAVKTIAGSNWSRGLKPHSRWEIESYIVMNIYDKVNQSSTVLDAVNAIIDTLQQFMVVSK